jgi:hypothetical protein
MNTDSLLADIRKELVDKIFFPYIFLDNDDKEIEKNQENEIKLEDILSGKNLNLKKETIKREMLGEYKKKY